MPLCVIRGCAANVDADRAATATMLDRTAETGQPVVRVWQPFRQVAFGRRDTREAGYDSARATAADQGYAAVERRVGGRAVAYTGETLAFAHTIPVDDIRRGTCDRYGVASETLIEALDDLGADVVRGEPADAYCPGSHSVSGVGDDGEPLGKIAGLAQRVQSGAALVAGCLTVSRADEADLTAVLQPVYDAIDVPFDPHSVGSVSAAGGPDDPELIARRLEGAFADGRHSAVTAVGDLLRETA